jgi:RNA polymerase sigma-70 factor (ECF subfamily)
MSLEAVRRIAEIGAVQRDVFGWLCQIAEHRLIDAHRRFFAAEKRAADREVALDAKVGESRAFADLLIASITSPSQAFSRDQKQLALQTAMADLPAECQEALRLRYVEGLASKEIAVKMGKTDGAVRVLLTRSLQRLQKLLESA